MSHKYERQGGDIGAENSTHAPPAPAPAYVQLADGPSVSEAVSGVPSSYVPARSCRLLSRATRRGCRVELDAGNGERAEKRFGASSHGGHVLSGFVKLGALGGGPLSTFRAVPATSIPVQTPKLSGMYDSGIWSSHTYSTSSDPPTTPFYVVRFTRSSGKETFKLASTNIDTASTRLLLSAKFTQLLSLVPDNCCGLCWSSLRGPPGKLRNCAFKYRHPSNLHSDFRPWIPYGRDLDGRLCEIRPHQFLLGRVFGNYLDTSREVPAYSLAVARCSIHYYLSLQRGKGRRGGITEQKQDTETQWHAVCVCFKFCLALGFIGRSWFGSRLSLTALAVFFPRPSVRELFKRPGDGNALAPTASLSPVNGRHRIQGISARSARCTTALTAFWKVAPAVEWGSTPRLRMYT
ncbi:hypothetical protein B0H17DRAFT_1123617 [Mycena rosella]|uniref:Uncharacterized protein n=1 Tax=Mycena rosella TaxID=1033263 RepID=A0AAD7H233_MYCRO|nr:hypothetical protein B0H17DRAFT_1123617 [Mycena rosella]